MDGESGHGTEADTGRHWSTEAEVDQLMHDEQHKVCLAPPLGGAPAGSAKTQS